MAVTGWLAPDGQFIECGLYEHIEIIAKNDIFVKKVPKVGEIISDLEDMERDHQELAEREGSHNAEWHLYEIACDRIRPRIRNLLLNEGFIRVGESGDDIHFEGRPNVLKSQYQRCKDFADQYAAGAVFEPQR